MALHKKNLNTELTTGFGEKSTQSGNRYYRKDGKPNIVRKGIKFFDQLSWYHTMISMPRWKFWSWLLITYIIVNAIFASIYYAVGIQNLNGVDSGSALHNYLEAFFFSFQTFTTVGYGHVSPSGLLTSSVAAFESFLGVLTLALAAGLFYGRFSRPRSFLRFSDIALIAPYKNGTALMFRTTPYKNNHLMDAEVKWTIVHPINENSPIYGMTLEELREARAEMLVYLKAYDEGFANTVVARTSYTADEMIEGAKFKPMYERSASGEATLLHIDKLNEYEKVTLPQLKAVES
jgi:inward rectifier potassium channel